MGAKNRRKNLHKHPGPPFQIRGGPGSFSTSQPKIGQSGAAKVIKKVQLFVVIVKFKKGYTLSFFFLW